MAGSAKNAQVNSLSIHNRSAILDEMEKSTFDLVVIGGGITGAGVARDAASRGMKVALVEARDFAIGTSSRSSKLIHGGIRYLENLEFGLVFEALSERRLLFELAPHLVHPLRFVLPLYQGGRVGMFKMGLGMWLYDALSMFEAPEMHERLDPKETVERLPQLQAQKLLGSYVYSDAYMDDDRLVLETLRSAVTDGALCANHVQADTADMVDGKVVAIGCTDQITGRKIKLRAHHFVSTVGPWTDIVAPKIVGEWKKILRPSKGVHLTFDRKRIPLTQAVVMAAEKRIVFGIPRHEMIIIGTTDTDYSGDPKDVSVTPEDVRYLLKVAGDYFPGAKLTAKDIISCYAGVRPLVDDGAETESKTSREHLILRDPRNVTFVAGGKYTTYRLMAEQTVQTALEAFSVEDQVRYSRSQTKVALNPLATPGLLEESLRMAPQWSKEFGLSIQDMELMIGRHGAEALLILESGFKNQNHQGLGQSSDEKLWALEARHAMRQTMCFDLVDFYVRRAPLFLAREDHGLSLLGHLSGVFAQEAGWGDSKRQEQEKALRSYVSHEMIWKQEF